MAQLRLWRGEKSIRDGLQRALDSARVKPMESIEQELRQALKAMSTCLYDALRCYLDDDMEGLDAYFWPGYDSILATLGGVSRLMLKSSAGTDIGIGLMGRDAVQYEEYFGQIAFDSLLIRSESDSLASGAAFHPGGTHPWISARELKLSGDLPLNAIAIEILPKAEGPREFAVDSDNGVLSIFLDRSDFREWGQAVASVLNGDSAFAATSPRDSDPPPDWPYARRANDQFLDDEDSKKVHDFRLKLYIAWLASNLSGSPEYYEHSLFSGYPQWVAAFVKELRCAGLTALADRLNALQKSRVESHFLPYWYTFNLERTVSIPQKPLQPTGAVNRLEVSNELGSLMILTSKPIPREFFCITKPWVERIYGWMRFLESSVLTFRLGAESQLSEFVHQTRDLVDLVLLDPHISSLSPAGRSAAWHLQAVTRVWSSAHFDGHQPLVDSPDPFWRTLGSHSAQEFLGTLIDYAIRHTFRRALLGSGHRYDAVEEALFQYVSNHYEASADALAQLQMVIEGDPPEWIKTVGFVVAFHHCFWQAAYHGLRASVNGLEPPFLWIKCETNQLTIYNRSELSALTNSPKDWVFFRRLENRVKGFFSINSHFDEVNRIVVTCIAREVPGCPAQL
jgi:hypothetical protein